MPAVHSDQASPGPAATADNRRESENEKGSDKWFDGLNTPAATLSANIKPNTYRQRMRLITPTPGTFLEFIRHVYQPFIALLTIPGIAWAAMIFGSLLAWFSVLLNAMSIYMTYQPYNFSPMDVGLMNLAPFIGSIIGSVYGGAPCDYLIKKLAKRNGGIYEPEMRLWLVLPAVVLTPLSLIFFGLCLVHVSPKHVGRPGSSANDANLAAIGCCLDISCNCPRDFWRMFRLIQRHCIYLCY